MMLICGEEEHPQYLFPEGPLRSVILQNATKYEYMYLFMYRIVVLRSLFRFHSQVDFVAVAEEGQNENQSQRKPQASHHDL